MNKSMGENFQKRFGNRIEVVYVDKEPDPVERQFRSQQLAGAVKALITAVLKRDPTQEELLGIKPILIGKKMGTA